MTGHHPIKEIPEKSLSPSPCEDRATSFHLLSRKQAFRRLPSVDDLFVGALVSRFVRNAILSPLYSTFSLCSSAVAAQMETPVFIRKTEK